MMHQLDADIDKAAMQMIELKIGHSKVKPSSFGGGVRGESHRQVCTAQRDLERSGIQDRT